MSWSRLGASLAVACLAAVPLVPAGAEEPPAAAPGAGEPALEIRVEAAIRKGAAWLRAQQKPSGSLGGLAARGAFGFETGATALGGLALLAAGDRRGDAELDRIHEWLKKKDELLEPSGSRTTYDAALLLLFLSEYWRADEDGRPGGARARRRADHPCGMAAEVRAWVQDVVNWLVRVRKVETATWGYPARRDDASNTQFAFLGLGAARACGAKIPPQVFLQGVRTVVARQEEGARPASSSGRATGEKAPDPLEEASVRPRGWSYQEMPFVATGSATAGALNVLAICDACLAWPRRAPAYGRDLQIAVEHAVRDGFAWLEHHWTVERNPGPASANWHHYWLFSLTCGGELLGLETLGPRAWHREIAGHLVATQETEGFWCTGTLGNDDFEASPLIDTAFALLALARYAPQVGDSLTLGLGGLGRLLEVQRIVREGDPARATRLVVNLLLDADAEARDAVLDGEHVLIADLMEAPATRGEFAALKAYRAAHDWIEGQGEKIERYAHKRKRAFRSLERFLEAHPNSVAAEHARRRLAWIRGLEED